MENVVGSRGIDTPDSTRAWQRLGSIIHLIQQLQHEVCIGGDEVSRHATGLQQVSQSIKKDRFTISRNISDSTVLVAECTIAEVLESARKWQLSWKPPSGLMRQISVDWGYRIALALKPFGIPYVLYATNTTPVRSPLSRTARSPSVADAVFPISSSEPASMVIPSSPSKRAVTSEIKRKEAFMQIAMQRKNISVTGPLLSLSTDDETGWESHVGLLRNDSTQYCFKLFSDTTAAERLFRSELFTQLNLSYHPNIPNLVGWCYSTRGAMSSSFGSPRGSKFGSPRTSKFGSPRGSKFDSPKFANRSNRSVAFENEIGFSFSRKRTGRNKTLAPVSPSSPRESIAVGLPSSWDDDDDNDDEPFPFSTRLPQGPLLIFEHFDGPLDDVLQYRQLGKDAHRLVIAQVLRALIHIHASSPRGFVHGLINGNTVLIEPDGTTKLTGIETVLESDDADEPPKLLSETHSNPCYQAPELLLATGLVRPSSDIYSIGCLLYKMLTGCDPPLDPDNTSGVIQKAAGDGSIPTNWMAIIKKCVNSNPKERPTAADVLAMVENTIAVVEVEQPSPEITPQYELASDVSSEVVSPQSKARRDLKTELSLLGCDISSSADSSHASVSVTDDDSSSSISEFAATRPQKSLTIKTDFSTPKNVKKGLLFDRPVKSHQKRQPAGKSTPSRTKNQLRIVKEPQKAEKTRLPMTEGDPIETDIVGTEPLMRRVPVADLEEDEMELFYEAGELDKDDNWVLERKHRLLEIERLRNEIDTLDRERSIEPFGYKQHVVEKESAIEFRKLCDDKSQDATGILRENGGKYKGTAYADLSMAVWCQRTGATSDETHSYLEQAVKLAAENDAEPLSFLGFHFIDQYNAKIQQVETSFSILILNDNVIRLSSYNVDTLPPPGCTIKLPMVSDNLIWFVEQSIQGGVKITTREQLEERRRVLNKFMVREDCTDEEWNESEEILWKSGQAEIGQEFKHCGSWCEAEETIYDDQHNKLQQKLDIADEIFSKAAGIDPTHLQSMSGYAKTLVLKKEYESAVKIIRQALKYNKEEPMLYAQLAEVLHHHFPSQHKEAEAAYRSAAKFGCKTEQANLQGNLASFLVQTGARVASLTAFRSALEADPDHANNLYNAALFLKIVGRSRLELETRSADADVRKEPTLSVIAYRLLKRSSELGHRNADRERHTLHSALFYFHPKHAHAASHGPAVIPEGIDHLFASNIPRDIPTANYKHVLGVKKPRRRSTTATTTTTTTAPSKRSETTSTTTGRQTSTSVFTQSAYSRRTSSSRRVS